MPVDNQAVIVLADALSRLELEVQAINRKIKSLEDERAGIDRAMAAMRELGAHPPVARAT